MYVSDRRHSPAAGPIVVGFSEDRKGGAMASNITLAIGNDACHMIYDEPAQARGIRRASGRPVPRAISRNSAETPDLVTLGRPRPRPTGQRLRQLQMASRQTR